MHRRRLLELARTKFPHIGPGWPVAPHLIPLRFAHVGQWFHAISDHTRMTILEFLSQRERCVSELQKCLGAGQSDISYHLKVLREAGLVTARRESRWRYYALRPDTLAHMAVFAQRIGPGKHVGTCPLSCCQET
jgi:ArsR family transcriptional regulator, arsenate/arsenite/antimonite-responsive transcriptional repressor